MKIACISNMNHMQFSIARYLLQWNHQVTLILMNEYEHFLPENDCFELPKNLNIIRTNYSKEEVLNLHKSEIKKLFYGYDFIIGSEWAPAFLARINAVLDVFIPIGTDLVEYPFYPNTNHDKSFWFAKFSAIAKLQYVGIKKSRCTFVRKNADLNLEKGFKRIGFEGERIFESLPGMYIKDFEGSINIKNSQREKLEFYRNENYFIIINTNRNEFIENNIHHKGTDIFLKGIRELADRQGVRKFIAVLFEYGTDVAAAKELIQKLNLEQFIVWLPKMGRKELFEILKMGDVGIGNVKTPFFFPNSTLEYMAAGLPIVMNLNAEHQYHELPLYKGSSQSEIATSLQILFEDTDLSEKRKIISHWFEEYIVQKPLLLLKERINRKQPKRRKNSYLYWINITIDLELWYRKWRDKIYYRLNKIA